MTRAPQISLVVMAGLIAAVLSEAFWVFVLHPSTAGDVVLGVGNVIVAIAAIILLNRWHSAGGRWSPIQQTSSVVATVVGANLIYLVIALVVAVRRDR